LRLQIQFAGGVGLVGGVVSLLGWVFAVPRLIDWFGYGITIKTNPALCAIAAGGAILLLSGRPSRGRTAAADGLAIFVVVVAAATLSQHTFGWNLGLDTALFDEAVGARATAAPNRMGMPSSTSFLALGLALLALAHVTAWTTRVARTLGLFVVLVSSLSLVGYAYGATELFDVATLTGIAAQAALILNSLGWAVLALSLAHQPASMILAPGPGGALARRLMPIAVVVPAVLGWAGVVAQRADAVEPPLAFAGVALATIVVLVSLILTVSRSVEGSAALLAAGEAAMLEREREARTQAERAVRTKDDFIAVVSHELRTPLNSLMGWSQVLKMPVLDAGDRAKAAQAIERGVRLQTRLVDDLLDISGIVSGKLRLALEPVPIRPLVEAAVQGLTAAAAAKQVTVTVNFDPGPGSTLLGDPIRLEQVIANLLSNAIKFSAPGGGVRVSTASREDAVQIVVVDHGEGIAGDLLPLVFDRFQQADSSRTRKHGGLGLGLTIVKHLVELHGGTVTAASAGAGRGATFTILLPASGPSGQGRALTTGPPPGERTADLTGIRVLAVDDDADARELTVRLLGEYGASVTTAGSASEALAMLSQALPDVLLTDIGMPAMDGYEFIGRVRACHGALPAIAMSAFGRADDRLRSLESGFDLHLAKPVDPVTLAAAIVSLTASVAAPSGPPSHYRG
jgi:signal transduction histidine kinase/ActR/RegA family two-component response regulator